MSVEIRPATLRDLTYIAANIRDQDRREIQATINVDSMTEAAIITWHVSQGWCWCAWLDGQPVGAYGVGVPSLIYQPHMRSAWAFGTDKFKRAVPAISRHMIDTLAAMFIGQGVTRVECRSLDGHDLAHKWLKSLKCRHEAVMVQYGVNGETFHLWAWVKEDFKDVLS